jgi:hypothetical protein
MVDYFPCFYAHTSAYCEVGKLADLTAQAACAQQKITASILISCAAPAAAVFLLLRSSCICVAPGSPH